MSRSASLDATVTIDNSGWTVVYHCKKRTTLTTVGLSLISFPQIPKNPNSFFKKFDGIADKLRWVCSSFSNLVVDYCITIVDTLNTYESEPRFCSVVTATKTKWLELFPEIPTIYCAATILDPRMKVEGLRQRLVYYYESLGVNYDVDEKVAACQMSLQQLYDIYTRPYARSREYEAEMASVSEEDKIKINSTWELDMKKNVLKRKRVDDQEKSGELGEYYFFQSYVHEDEKDDELFGILDWWRKRRHYLRILPKLAKDVICTPLSIFIPNQKCCPRKRVLDEKRSMLKPELIEVCICKEDWKLAEVGIQGEDVFPDVVLASSDSEAEADE